MNEVSIINEQTVLGKSFRVYGTIEEPLFLAKDVAEWIEHSNLTVMVNSVDEDEKLISRTKDSLGRVNTATFLTENGLYEVLMLSRKPIAKQFKQEVKKVLHSLRVNGGYISGQENLSDDELIAKALILANNVIKEKDKKINCLQYKQGLLMHHDKTYTLTEIAKELGFRSAKAFTTKLNQDEILFKKNDVWLPYADYSTKGYFEEKQIILEDDKVVYTTHVTQKGRMFLLHYYKRQVSLFD